MKFLAIIDFFHFLVVPINNSFMFGQKIIFYRKIFLWALRTFYRKYVRLSALVYSGRRLRKHAQNWKL